MKKVHKKMEARIFSGGGPGKMIIYAPIKFLFAFVFFVVLSTCRKSAGNVVITHPADTTFTNPLLPSGPDPWVVQADSSYYYTNTLGNRLAIFKTSKMSELSAAVPTVIWSPPSGTSYSKEIWAPELHRIDGKWYMYFAADDGNNINHRIYVLENDGQDPLSGGWTLRGKVYDSANDKWAIDASEFEYNGHAYLLWSGWPGDTNIEQDIFIAKLKDPWTIDGSRVMISAPQYDWEKQGSPPAVNEGPEILINPQGRVFLTYSASGCWTDNYVLGLLTLKDGGDPMQAGDWVKTDTPVFVSNSSHGAFSPGHNGFFISKDGKENWIIYHANPAAGLGCGDSRSPRMQRFFWRSDGAPDFGVPVPIQTPIKKPGGE